MGGATAIDRQGYRRHRAAADRSQEAGVVFDPGTGLSGLEVDQRAHRSQRFNDAAVDAPVYDARRLQVPRLDLQRANDPLRGRALDRQAQVRREVVVVELVDAVGEV